MDTRTKILTPEQAAQTALALRRSGSPLLLVTGFFDPVLAEHARRLAAVKRDAAALMVLITSPQQPILTAPARAELVAALAMVDYVVLPGESGADDLIGQLRADRVERQEAVHEQITRKLIAHAHSRQQAK